MFLCKLRGTVQDEDLVEQIFSVSAINYKFLVNDYKRKILCRVWDPFDVLSCYRV